METKQCVRTLDSYFYLPRWLESLRPPHALCRREISTCWRDGNSTEAFKRDILHSEGPWELKKGTSESVSFGALLGGSTEALGEPLVPIPHLGKLWT